VLCSRLIDATNNLKEICTWVNYILQCARRITPPTTHLSSTNELVVTNENFEVIVESYRKEEEESEEEDFDEDAFNRLFDKGSKI
jgi:hypothetical protein